MVAAADAVLLLSSRNILEEVPELSTPAQLAEHETSCSEHSLEQPEFFPLLGDGDLHCDAAELLTVISRVLVTLVETNELQEHLRRTASGGGPFPALQRTIFHGLQAPPIAMEAYLQRIFKYAKCSPVCFVLAFIYVTKLSKRDPALQLTALNAHRLVLTAVLLAAKFADDHYFNNAVYARVGGTTTAELNRMELEMLRLLDFRLHAPLEVVRRTLAQLQSGQLLLEASCSKLHLGCKRRSSSRQEQVDFCVERPPHRRTSRAIEVACDGPTSAH